MNGRAILAWNPELQRLLWLELTPTRLIVMPVLAVIVFGGMFLSDHIAGISDTTELALTALLILWGSRLAVESVAEEITGRTWDVQRLSAANPWAMALGKLVGGTSYALYGAVIAVIVAIAVDPDRAAERLPTLLIGGLVAQTAGLFAIFAMHRAGRHGRGSSAIAQAFGILAGLGVISRGWPTFAPSMGLTPTSAAQVAHMALAKVTWYGITMSSHWFFLALSLLYAIWLIVGVAVVIRREMGERGGPLAWTLFVVYSCIVSAGYARFGWQLEIQIPSQVAFIAATATYVALFVSSVSKTSLRRLAAAASGRSKYSLWSELPAWIPSAAIALGAAIALMILTVFYSIQPGAQGAAQFGPSMVFGWMGNFVRDLLLICAVRLAFERRTGLLLLALFALLYGFFPVVLGRMHEDDWRQVFWPQSDTTPEGLLGPWVLAVAVLALLVVVIRRRATARIVAARG